MNEIRVKCQGCGGEEFETRTDAKLEDEAVCKRCGRRRKLKEVFGSKALDEAKKGAAKMLKGIKF